MELIIGGSIGLAAGTLVAYLIQITMLKKRNEQVVKTAELEGEALKKEKILQAKEKFLKLKEDHEETMKDRERRMQSLEDKARGKEKAVNQKIGRASCRERV